MTLDVQRALKHHSGGMQALVSVGMAVIRDAPFPSLDGVLDALETLSSRYRASSRNIPDHERLQADPIGDCEVRFINATPHSDDVVFGYLHGVVRRFAPKRSIPLIRFEDYDRCDSDADTVFLISW